MSEMPRSTSQEAAVVQHLVPLQGARGWKRQNSVSIVWFSFLLLVLLYCAKHKAFETKHEKLTKKEKTQGSGKQYS